MTNSASATQPRALGLVGATSVGIGAIVGGGIFVLAGVAYSATGPAAIIAFAINGGVALLTAMSFAEMATAFPENGGAYTFAKKVLTMRAAFAVGWIIWFAYIIAGVLYALGFAAFAALTLRALWELVGSTPPQWLYGRDFALIAASTVTVWYGYSLSRKSVGGGQWFTVGKVVIFTILIVAGLITFFGANSDVSTAPLSPFFAGGAAGLFLAMGFTFIALQGFDLIAAVAGEVKHPGRTIPRAMFLSLGCALLIYLPLLFVVAAVGVEPGTTIQEMAIAQPENIIPAAAQRFMGPVGYWLVLVAALLSTLSALEANVLAASRVALAMAQDRSLPQDLARLHRKRGTPAIAIYASVLTLICIIYVVPDLAAAGSAASLIFLLAFTLAHITAFLARRRQGTTEAPYRTPWFPLIPVAGGLSCCGLAIFQIVVAPDAAAIVIVWLGFGVMLYLSLFAHHAEVADAARTATDPDLVRLRGQSPLVLVPVVNPANAVAMVSVGNVLAPRRVGKVLLLSIVRTAAEAKSHTVPPEFESVKQVVDESLRQSYRGGYAPEMLITAAADPFAEIERIAREHRCGSLLLGLGDGPQSAVEKLIEAVGIDVALVRSAPNWRLDDVKRVLVPVGGRGEQHELRARVLGSMSQAAAREFIFVTVVAPSATEAQVERVRVDLGKLADLKGHSKSEILVLRASDPIAALSAETHLYDLMVLGLHTGRGRKSMVSGFSLSLAQQASCATVLLGRRPRGFGVLSGFRR